MALDEQDKQWLTEQLEKMETKLLDAFFDYQEAANVRFRKMSADVSNIDAATGLRLDNLERRIVKLEERYLRGDRPQ